MRVKWIDGPPPPTPRRYWWIVTRVSPQEGDPFEAFDFVQAAYIGPALLVPSENMLVQICGAFSYRYDGFAEQILAHAPMEKPKAPKPKRRAAA